MRGENFPAFQVNDPDNSEKSEETKKTNKASACACISLEYWTQYFEVTEIMILDRLKSVASPQKPALAENIGENPDLYGPVWICAILCFTLTLGESFYNLIKVSFSSNEHKDKRFDFAMIPKSFTLVYGSLVLFPLAYMVINRCMGHVIPLMKIVSVFGYSFSVYIIAALVNLIPISSLHYFTFGVAGVYSIALIIRNFAE